MCADFSGLTPDVLIDGVEQASGIPLVGFAHPLNSYINRVYELQAVDRTRIIAKFYRPGRWSAAAVQDEHDFVSECADDEIPVVAPMRLPDGSTIGDVDGFRFAVYPKRRGREFEALTDEHWRRLGRIIGRMHVVGMRKQASNRITMHPEHSTKNDIQHLLQGQLVTAKYRREFEEVTSEIMTVISPVFADAKLIRIHGDCHQGNILERPEEGLIMIDFDDMVMGPAVQDLWMLLPDHANRSRREMNLILEGYELFQDFDDYTLKMIEPLRAMRMLYFLAWCSKQSNDHDFTRRLPDWGGDAFWRRQVGDLQQQLQVIREHLK